MNLKIDLQNFSQIVDGELLSNPFSEVDKICLDSRKDCSNGLFIPLRGESFDGHKFISNAIEAGAKAILLDTFEGQSKEEILSKVTVIKVANTLKSFQKFASDRRSKLGSKFICLTGTNGKTSTKDFARQIIETKFRTFSTQGNLNNQFGVPISICNIPEETQVSILELGMNHLGEIKELVEIVSPDIVGVTMVGRGHLEGLKTISNVAKAKEEIYKYSSSDCIKVFNLDNEWTRKMESKYLGSKIRFSQVNSDAEVFLSIENESMKGISIAGTIGGVKGNAHVSIIGSHNIQNLSAAASFALSVGMKGDEIWNTFEKCHLGWGRNQIINTEKGASLIFDGYNANPESFEAALKMVSRLNCTGKKFLVAGDMLELGEESSSLHLELAKQIAQVKFYGVYFVGNETPNIKEGLINSGYTGLLSFGRKTGEINWKELESQLNCNDLVLVKGSRGNRLENVVTELRPINFNPNY